jgi:gas vesicle protein
MPVFASFQGFTGRGILSAEAEASGRPSGCRRNRRKRKQHHMKRNISFIAGLALASGLALAQNGPGPGEPKKEEEAKSWSNQYSYIHAGQSAAGGGGQVKNRFGKPELPADVQTIVQQFQQDRTRLMNQLKACSDEQRQEVLKEMEQLRTQLREQIRQFREQARQQAEQMRTRLGNNRDRVLDQGAGKGGGGRDR